MGKQFWRNIEEVICFVVLVANSVLVDLQPFILLILGGFTVRNQDITTALSGELILVTGSAKPKKELKDKRSRKHTIGLESHLERPHFC